MTIDRNWGAQGDIAQDALATKLLEVIKLYKKAFGWLVIGTILLVALGVKLNQSGFAVANFVLALGFLLVLGFYIFHPAGLLTVFGIGGLSGLPKDWSFNQLLREGKLPNLSLSEVANQGLELVRKLVHYSAHVAYFAIVVFTVLGTWYIQDAVAVLPVFVMLAGIGLWAALSKVVAKWYYRITLGIIMVSLLIFLYQAFFGGKSEMVTKEGATSWAAAKAPVVKGAAETVSNMFDDLNYQHSVTIGITEEAFRPAGQQFCGEGVRPGKWQFVFPREAELEKWHKQESGFRTINPDGSTNTPQSFISRVRINKVMSGEERVVIGDDDCFRVFIKAPPGAVMLGNPVFYNGKAVPFGPDSEPKPAIVTIRFFG